MKTAALTGLIISTFFQISKADLIAQYKFENNTSDNSGNNYHGTVHGTAGYVNGPATLGGKAFSFNGSTNISVAIPMDVIV